MRDEPGPGGRPPQVRPPVAERPQARSEALGAALGTGRRRRGISAGLIRLMAVMFLYMTSVGMLVPVLPRYVTEELGGGEFEVGVAYGVFAVTALLGRPLSGVLADRIGAKPVVLVSLVLAALTYGAAPLTGTVIGFALLRLIYGLGHAGMYVPTLASAGSVGPPDRVGESVSYFTLAHYLGLTLGPGIGAFLLDGYGTYVAWGAAAVMALASGAFALWAPLRPGPAANAAPAVERPAAAPARRWRLIHPAGVLPGVAMSLIIMGHTAVSAFVAVHVSAIGVGNVGVALAIYGVVNIVVRIAAVRLVDGLGTFWGVMLAATAVASGTLLIGVWWTPVGLYLGIVLVAVGQSLQGPLLATAVFHAAPPDERAAAVGTYSAFADLSVSAGSALLGAVAAGLGSPAAAFVAAAVLALMAIPFVFRRRQGRASAMA